MLLGGPSWAHVGPIFGSCGVFLWSPFSAWFPEPFGMRFGLQLGPKSAPKTAPGSYPNQLQSKARKSAKICTTPKQNAYFCPPEGTQNGPQRAPRSLRNATETTTPKRDQKGTQNSPTWAPKSAPKPLLNGPERAPKNHAIFADDRKPLNHPKTAALGASTLPENLKRRGWRAHFGAQGPPGEGKKGRGSRETSNT